ncbi:MAG: hypothetical protein MK324_13350 [Pirellulales bacterium]|jgi:hypothetical protein|nr:hypothetical protein [Pirellulales bacterium]|tara:strand:+ start:516 stop:863 length:348 start_codon:yes stop_codon:yes gene_type:complete
MNCLFLSSDLMFGPRVTHAAAMHGSSVKTVLSPGKLEDELQQGIYELAILDLSCSLFEPAVVFEIIASSGQQIKTLAFGPHVQGEKLVGARQAGFDEVMTNGQFNQNLSEIFAIG